MLTYKSACLVAGLAVFLAACSGGSSSPSTGPLTLSVTDSALNTTAIDAVCVSFSSITVHYANHPDVVVDYKPLPSQVTSMTHCPVRAVGGWNGTGAWDGTGDVPPIRVDALSGSSGAVLGRTLTAALAESLQVPVGRVTWIRLQFITDKSYVLDSGQLKQDLKCPSCDATANNGGRGFKLNRTFQVTSSGLALTVDIDLLKSLHQDSSGYVLRPTARIEPDDTIGTIAGTVDSSLIPPTQIYNGSSLETGCAVYVFQGAGVTPVDYYDTGSGSPVYSTARVRYDTASSSSASSYRYAAGALPAGTYTVALTCDPDDPTVKDTSVTFTAGQTADVTAGQTTEIDFPAQASP